MCGERERAIGLLRKDPEVRTISISGNDIVVEFHGGKEEEAWLLKRLVDGNIPVNGFLREQGDLESIFMQITNHDREKVVLKSEE